MIEGLFQTIICLCERIWSQGGVKNEIMVARSNVEAEFKDMAQEICELIWLKRLLTEIKIE